MSTIMFKCPSCGGYLEFDAGQQRFRCLYCGQVLTEEEMQAESARREAEAEARQAESAPTQESSAMKGYHCRMCGAEIVTEATTAATRCYFCHSPVVLQDRLDDAFRPDGVVPFAMDREAARERFMAYIRSKRFVDKRFFDDAQLEMFTGVYYPFWYFDVEGEAAFEGQGTRRSVRTTPSHIITTTRYFSVQRKAKMSFRDLARKALGKVDGKLADGIHPFEPGGVKPYAPGYLSGFLAETRDTEADALEGGVLQELQGYADRLIRSNHGFHSLSGETRFKAGAVSRRYVLLPVWVLTWKGGSDGAPYYYLMNGQTGKVCGKLPVSWKKLIGWAVGAGVAVCGLLLAGGMFIW
ncbi:MAG: TFIIB-type zinc ribbon-containing protein [Clostridia bacterium]|nr:TFIIB-type zinc ribbon-containing protein [Clostridia bacterium]